MTVANWMDWASAWLWLIPLGAALLGLWLCLTRHDLRRWIASAFVVAALLIASGGVLAHKFLNGHLKDRCLLLGILPNSWVSGELKGIKVGPIPRGTPVDLLMNMDPESPHMPAAVAALAKASLQIKKSGAVGDAAYADFRAEAGPALLAASKCPDFVLDRGHWFGEGLALQEKEDLIAFLKTL